MIEARLLTISEASESLYVSIPTAWRMVKDGRLPVVRLGPKTVRVDPAVLEGIRSRGVAKIEAR